LVIALYDLTFNEAAVVPDITEITDINRRSICQADDPFNEK
jgi:hypothetical protein